MPSGNIIDDDDYVVNLLKQDAKNAAKNYELVGIDAFNPKRSRSSAPKPNTNFLRHIIRQTDNHNAALLAKEAEESRVRLIEMERRNDSRQQSARGSRRRNTSATPPVDDNERHRKRRRYHSDDEGKQEARRNRRTDKKRNEKESEHEGSTRKRTSYDKDDERAHSDSRRSRHHHRKERKNRHHYSSDEEYERSSRRKRAERSHRRHRSRTRSKSRSRSPSPRISRNRESDYRSRSRSPKRRSERSEQSSHQHMSASDKKNLKHRSNSSASDSDPLEAIVGPLPPSEQPSIRTRGRGAHKAKSMGMDARFSSTYDPSNDVQLNSDAEDNFGDALEVYRDRQKWKRMGADRLKEAGFTDAQIKKWEKGGEKTEEDVVWAAKGEKREWDRNKIVDEEGNTELKADFGRLT
ncbi:hypothetical protein DM02DRAFT_552503 [Periconia macrospinosa]|uniref:Pre-mRNA-splicing factor 38B n=1 Tax=Periconia macrospinosa TaxID=97972 RepID=A0A2V1E7D2_9PLEO|nr:hypothetical protein DM02DRAFT_552503 [Periconia macrospinosa]